MSKFLHASVEDPGYGPVEICRGHVLARTDDSSHFDGKDGMLAATASGDGCWSPLLSGLQRDQLALSLHMFDLHEVADCCVIV